jgi:hypothetical protein
MWYGNPIGEELCWRAREAIKSMDVVIRQGEECDDSLSFYVPASEEEITTMGTFHRQEDETLFDFVKRSCVWCARTQATPCRCKLEFLIRSPGIWLHAYQYTFNIPGSGLKTFSADLPSWCTFE